MKSVELTFGEACKIESAIKHKVTLYEDFLSDALERKDEKSADTWRTSLDEYRGIITKIHAIVS